MPRENWTRNELLLAFNLYCKLPFGQFDKHNLEVMKVAKIIGRSPNAVAMKLSNFASLDPYHQNRGIRGLSNISKADKEIWNEFHQDWNQLASESESALEHFSVQNNLQSSVVENPEIVLNMPITEVERVTKIRLGQRFFRASVLANYGEKCCVCGIPIRSLLIASHIIPWHEREDLRTDPRNGLCLCALHDKAFDKGILGVSASFSILISNALGTYMPHHALENGFELYRGKQITLPDKFLPNEDFLTYHTDNIFQRN